MVQGGSRIQDFLGFGEGRGPGGMIINFLEISHPRGGLGSSNPLIRVLCRAMVFKIIPGAVRWPEHGGDCTLEVGDRDCWVEDADSDIVPGVFSSGSHPFCRSFWR